MAVRLLHSFPDYVGLICQMWVDVVVQGGQERISQVGCDNASTWGARVQIWSAGLNRDVDPPTIDMIVDPGQNVAQNVPGSPTWQGATTTLTPIR